MDPKLQPSSPAIHFHFLSILTFFFLCIAPSYQQVCNHQDKSALLTFNSSISFSLFKPLNWSYTSSCCQWEGVSCDANGSVTRLQLSYMGLVGVIASSIGDLTSLTHLNLSNNDLGGSLTEGIVRLTNLRVMDLSSNSISGPIPQQIGNLLYLEKLYLRNNNFSGPIPTSLMKCTNLVDLILGKNHLDGDISELDLSRFVQLQRLDLRNNSFIGTLPKNIYSCKSLIALGVNNLNVPILPEIVELKSLSFLSLASTRLTNITRVLTILANCKNLTALFLGENFYGESLPSDGPVGFPNLQLFSLDGCDIIGLIPEWLSNLKSLRVISLTSNKFTGEIPNSMGSLPNLLSLSLGNNLLSGAVPVELCRLPALVSESVVPKLDHFVRPYSLGKFLFSFDCDLYWFPVLDLSDNKLSGQIPWEIGNLYGLYVLNLTSNYFSGSIPATISDLKNLELLDLSYNNLTGGIPASLERLTSLAMFNVSYNNLQGPVLVTAQFGSFDELSYQGNPGLCGLPTNHPCYVQLASPDNKPSLLDGFYVGLASGFSGVLAVGAPYIWVQIWKQNRRTKLASCSLW